MEDLISHYKNIHDCFGDGDVNIVISANNILLVKQTESRVKTDLATESAEGANDAVIKAGVFSWTSGEKECNITHEALAWKLLSEVEMVVLCAHATRLKYLSNLLTMLESAPFFKKKINIWIDEADKSIKLWSKYESLLGFSSIHQVTLISATSDTLFTKYGRLQVLPYMETHPECYRSLKDAIKFEENFATANAVEFVKHVVLNNREKLVQPGMRAFIPGEMRKASHDAIADFLYNLGFIVIIINGDRKEILVPGEATIDLRGYLTVSNGETPEEFNIELAKLYKANNWARFPLAITGFYCVERGVTFQCGPEPGVHDGFLFDYGVIPPIPIKAEAYQTMARLFGNVGHLPNYKPVEIYTTSAMFKKVEKLEAIPMNLPRIVQEQGLVTVGKKELKEATQVELSSDWTLHVAEFTTLFDANEYAHSLGAYRRPKANPGHKGVKEYAKLKQLFANSTKFEGFTTRKDRLGVAQSRIWECYKDLADPTSVVYLCHVLTR